MNETITLTENPTSSKRGTVRLTAAQALVRYLAGLRTRLEGPQGDEIVPLFGGSVRDLRSRQRCWHWRGPLSISRTGCPPIGRTTNRRMAHAAIAYAKAHFRAPDDGLHDFHWARERRT